MTRATTKANPDGTMTVTLWKTQALILGGEKITEFDLSPSEAARLISELAEALAVQVLTERRS